MTSFKNVDTNDFEEIKKGLKKLFKITSYPTDDQLIIETFDIISLGSKFSVIYYKTGTLLIQGDESLEDFQLAKRFIEFSLES
jgi:hypothetical protein